MRITEEFQIKDATGHTLTLQNLTTGISYLDFGSTHLPRDFQGYRVKYTDRTAQPQPDGSFKVTESDHIYNRV